MTSERAVEPRTEGRTLREAAQRFLDADDTFDRFSDGPTDRRDVASFHRERAREALVRALAAARGEPPEPGPAIDVGRLTTALYECGLDSGWDAQDYGIVARRLLAALRDKP